MLLGIAAVRGAWDELGRAAASLGAFAAGVAVAMWAFERAAAPAGERWGRAVAVAVAWEAALLAALAVWWAVEPRPRPALIALAAVAMGVQSAATLRVAVPGVQTTYVTGTMTAGLAAIVRGASWRLALGVWGVYLLGALAGAALEDVWRPGAYVPAAALAALVAVVAARRR